MTAATDDKKALYLFCLAHAGAVRDVQKSGLDETDGLFSRTYGAVAAILTEVRVSDFCGPAAEQNLEDLGWVSERALRHERAVERVFSHGPVLPARFGTLFSSAEVLERFLETNQRTIIDFLESVRDHEEWGIKAQLERATARKWLSAKITKTTGDDAALSPGLRYVREKRAQAAAEKELHTWVANCCDTVAREMGEYVTKWRQRKMLDDRISGDSLETMLNIAVLIRRDRVHDLLTRVEETNSERAAQGLNLVLTGPWPPYSFCPLLEMHP